MYLSTVKKKRNTDTETNIQQKKQPKYANKVIDHPYPLLLRVFLNQVRVVPLSQIGYFRQAALTQTMKH